MDLLSIFQTLYKRKWILIGIPLLSAVAAIIFTMGYEKMYRSTAQLATGFTIAEEVKVTDERFNLYESDVKFDNLIETLNSPRVLSLLSYRLLIHDLETSKTAFRSIQEVQQEFPNLLMIDTQEIKSLLVQKLDSMNILVPYKPEEQKALDLLEAYEYDLESIKNNLGVFRVNRTDYVSVVAVSEDPYLSAYIVNVICEEFFRYNSTINSMRSDKSVNVFSQLVAQKKEELDQKAEALRSFKSSNSLLNFSAETESKISQIAELELDRQEEQKKLRSIVLNLDNIRERITIAEQSNQNTVNTKIVELRKRISTLNQQYIATGSNNESLANNIELLRDNLRKLTAWSSQSTASQGSFESLLERENELILEKKLSEQNLNAINGNLASLNRNAGGYASQEAQISALEREVRLASEEYKNAQEKYSKSLDISLASSSSIQQILVGQPASEPEPSQRLIVTALSGLSSLFLCIFVIVFLEYIDVSLKSISRFTNTVPIKLVGSLNRLNLKKHPLTKLFSSNYDRSDPVSEIFRESLRKLRFELDKHNHQIYLFTSTKPREGKTLVIDALSKALSLSGTKVLIIDFNFSSNSLTRYHKAKPTLEYILMNDKSNFNEAISRTAFPRIDIIGCEGGGYSPVEITNRGRINCLLEFFSKEYDYIFLEGAALNVYSDSRELSEYAEGIIAIFSSNSTIKQSDKESISFLSNLTDKNVGAVLNNVEIENLKL